MISIIISVFFLILAIINQFTLKLELNTIILIFIAMLPWLSGSLKSFRGFGLEIDFQELNDAGEKVKKSFGLDTKDSPKNQKLMWIEIFDNDPNLALAGLRIEIEKSLRDIAKSYNLETKHKFFDSFIFLLEREKILSPEEAASLKNLRPILNSAVHGATIDKRALDLVVDIGPKILESLRSRMKK